MTKPPATSRFHATPVAIGKSEGWRDLAPFSDKLFGVTKKAIRERVMFRQFARPLAALPFLLLQACSGGGGDASSCDAVGGNPNAGVVHGTYDNLEAVADSSLGTFAELFADTGSAFINTTGKQFAGGANAGVFVTPPAGMQPTDITLNTYLNSAPVDTATGAALTVTETGSDPATHYIA